MNWSVAKIGTIYQKPAQAIGLSTPPIGCVLDLSGLPGGGNKIYDRSPYGNIGTITGAVWRRLPSGLWYLDFDGTDDYVTVSDAASLSALGPLTFEAWIKASAVAGSIVKKDTGVSGGREWLFKASTDGKLSVSLFSAVSSNYLDAVGTKNTLDGVLHCVTVTWDGVNATGHIKLFIDGEEDVISYEGKAGTGCVPHDSTADVKIGLNFIGDIALLQVYDRALSALEIQSQYQREKHLFGVW